MHLLKTVNASDESLLRLIELSIFLLTHDGITHMVAMCLRKS